MKKWYRPVVQEINVQDLIKEVTVNASSGGSGGSGGTGSDTCVFFAGCKYALNCDNIFVF